MFHRTQTPPSLSLVSFACDVCDEQFMDKRGSCRHTWHPTRRALGVASMQPGGRLDVQEHTRNACSRRLASSGRRVGDGRSAKYRLQYWSGTITPYTHHSSAVQLHIRVCQGNKNVSRSAQVTKIQEPLAEHRIGMWHSGLQSTCYGLTHVAGLYLGNLGHLRCSYAPFRLALMLAGQLLRLGNPAPCTSPPIGTAFRTAA